MNISELFIKRPIATSLFMCAIILFGMVAYRSLAVSDLPNVDFPTLLVTASLPGANPETMASAVATPMENQFSTIAGLNSMTSVNSQGATQITLEFDLSRSLDGAAVDVQAAITQASRLLPPGMPTPPTFTKVNPADQPILYLALTSTTLPLYTLDEYAETRIAQRISMVSGVAQVQVLGAQKYAVHVQMDPQKLAAHQVGINEIETALKNWNVNLPAGSIIGPQRAFTLQASGQLTNAPAYRPLVVSYRKGTPVRLEELGQVIDGVEDDKTASWFYRHGPGHRAVVLAIQRQPGTNTIAVTDAIKHLIPLFQSELPPSVKMEIFYDRSDTIRESYDDVQFTMILTLGLVVMVIFLFLRNFSATVIPSLALPFSVIGTFAVMYLLDYSLDNLSMMALILSIGFVVDDAIVMLENIVRHIEMGEEPMAAALKGSKEIGFTIVSMTLSLAAVFIPVLFMGGVLGRLFKEFAVTICVSILISGVVSVTLTPMLCSRFLRAAHHQSKGWFYNSTERFFEGMLRLYDNSLQVVLRFRRATLAVSFVVLIITGWMFVDIPKGFIPDQDTDQMLVTTEAAQGTSFYQMVKYQQAIAEEVQADPNVDSLVSSIGGNTSTTLGGPNFGQMIVHLKPRHDRKMLVNEVIDNLRPKLTQFPGMKVYIQNPPAIQIGGQVTKSIYQFSMQSPDKEELYKASRKMEAEIAAMPGLEDVTSNLLVQSPQIHVNIDRDKSAALQINAQQVENALYDAYGPRWVSTIYAPVNEYKVLLELMPKYQADPNALSMLYLKTTAGRLIPLDSVAQVTSDTGPQTVNHFGQLPAVTISFNLRPGTSLGDTVTQIEKLAKEQLPPTVSTAFQGAAKSFQSSLSNLWLLLIVAILVVYIVLGVLYESYIHPLTILSGLPSAGFGALVTLYIFHMDLNIYAFVGLIMLIGIVKKNAIMQIDFALDAERHQGMSAGEAIYQGCLIRFRPIMMTTMAALLGAVPIALGYGAGGEARQPLGLAVVGGLLFSQLVTLYLTPVVYTYMAGLQDWLRRRKGADSVPEPIPTSY
ncbi:efflux RND transporter permease subunit [Paludibaculum fermentans]|uniref:Efflux RND transporter permease subunit n=1 Tax=Paludibaculum fermentans TaxID=1473598 RepID=A0A7S7NSS1_PALFE|nr:efflux RND transporter permease subunit [Paludibaculum fermentans]QOY89036.1 efflux RND transporter permease subunit [Paludibaculum fermentans]